jgi:methylmalonyl-CoA epimerase
MLDASLRPYILKLDHTAIAVQRIRDALPLYRDLLGGELFTAMDQPRQGFRWAQLLYPGGSKIELLEPISPDGFVARFLAKYGEGVHHLTFKVRDIEALVAQARARGLRVVDEDYSDALWIISVFVLADDLMTQLGHHSHVLTEVPDAEVITVAMVAAKYFHNHHERTLCLMHQQGYLSGSLSVSRFSRRLHALDHWLGFMVETLAAVFTPGEVFIINSMPIPTCRRARASRCRKVRGRDYCGYCAAKKEKFFGWRLHLIFTPEGMAVRYTFLPSGWHDLTPVYELTLDLSVEATSLGIKAMSARRQASSFWTTIWCGWWPSPGRTRRHWRGPTSTTCGKYAMPLRPSTANWRAWASNASTPAPSRVWNSRFVRF